jgi:hypothetical protein
MPVISDEVKQSVIKHHIDTQENLKKQKKALENYELYIANYEYKRSLDMDNICEEIEAYASANGSYYELILFHLHDFLESFNYTKYIYLRFYNNIRSDPYYSCEEGSGNGRNLVTALENKESLAIFNNRYKSKETLGVFADLITMRIKDSFVIYNYSQNKIKHPYIYKSNIYNYISKDFLYDYTRILDKTILLSPCEHDDSFLNIAKGFDLDLNIDIAIAITRNMYSIDFESFIDMSFIIKYHAKHFSKDGSKTLHTFYSDKMASLVIPELYKVFLCNIKNSKKIYELYEKTKYQYTVDIKDELNSLNKELCPNMSGLIFICKCNYVHRLWRMIFNTTNHYHLYYPEKRSISIINDLIIREAREAHDIKIDNGFYI